MKIIGYVIKDIKNNRMIVSIICIFHIVLMIFLGFLLHIIRENQEEVKSIKVFQKGFDDAYIVVDETDDETFSKIIENADRAIEEYSKLFDALVENDIRFYTEFGYTIYVDEQGNNIEQRRVTNGFFDIFHMSVLEGRLFDEKDYDEVGDEIPVIVGYQLRDKYEVGKKYQFDDGGSGEQFWGKVIGILDKNAEYCELNNYSVKQNLDYSYVLPQNYKNMDKLSFSDLDMAETKMVVFGDRNEIQKIISNNSPIKVSLINVSDHVQEILNDQVEMNIISALIALALIAVSFVISSVGAGKIFVKQLNEYRIHMFCGARRNDIVCRYMVLTALELFVGIVVAGFIHRDFYNLMGLIVCALLLIVIESVYPYYKVKRELR
ncbi:MAG: hypothetical protein E7282_09470 [Lachnospiraceae bacterium]|nr:hypothetical protein [Lachnospiraceae bacterium]